MSNDKPESKKKKGRPRTESIPRFNVDTFLSSNRKFLMFRSLSGCDERAAFLHIVRYFNFVNANCAMKARLGERDIVPLALFCWWDRKPEEFYQLLKDSGFLHEDGTVHEQDLHQPLAAQIRADRERKAREEAADDEQGEEGESDQPPGGVARLFPDLDPEKSGKVRPQTENAVNYEPITSQPDESENSDTGAFVPPSPPEQDSTCQEFVTWWNEEACSQIPEMKRVTKLTPERERILRHRLKEPEFHREAILEALRRSPHARGTPYPGESREWVLDFDFLIGMPSKGSKKERPESYVKLLEGKYAGQQRIKEY